MIVQCQFLMSLIFEIEFKYLNIEKCSLYEKEFDLYKHLSLAGFLKIGIFFLTKCISAEASMQNLILSVNISKLCLGNKMFNCLQVLFCPEENSVYYHCLS